MRLRREIAIVGDSGAADTRALLEICRAGIVPARFSHWGNPALDLSPSHYCRTEIRSMAMLQPMCASILCVVTRSLTLRHYWR